MNYSLRSLKDNLSAVKIGDTITAYVPLRGPIRMTPDTIGCIFAHITRNLFQDDETESPTVHVDISELSGGLLANVQNAALQHFQTIRNPDTQQSGYSSDELDKNLHTLVCIAAEFDHTGKLNHMEQVHLVPISVDETQLSFSVTQTDSCVITLDTAVSTNASDIVYDLERNLTATLAA